MAKKPRIRARVYEVVQYEINPETGESLNFNESNIINAIGNWGAGKLGLCATRQRQIR